MRRNAVLAHYARVLEEESELAKTAQRARSQFMQQVIKNAEGYCALEEPSPKLSLVLLQGAYEALASGEKVKPIRSFVRNVLLPIARPIQTPEIYDGTPSENMLNACSNAEYYYVDTLRQIRTGRNQDQKRISVYHDPEGTPLALRKAYEESSALTLQSIAIDDMIVPPGTIVGLNRDMNRTQTGEARRRHSQYATFIVEGSIAICPIRLSPWAYDAVLDRSLFAVDYAGTPVYDPGLGRVVETHSLDDFREAAHRVMAVCGVE